MLSPRKLLFVSTIKQIAAQWFQLTSKTFLQAVIAVSKAKIYYLACVLKSSKRLCLEDFFSFLPLFCLLLFYKNPSPLLHSPFIAPGHLMGSNLVAYLCHRNKNLTKIVGRLNHFSICAIEDFLIFILCLYCINKSLNLLNDDNLTKKTVEH